MNWALKSADEPRIQSLAAELRLMPGGAKSAELASPLARLLLMRGIDNPELAQKFLTPSLAHLHSPYAMTGMQIAVERLVSAIERKEGILIYGDYDVDGTTAIVILKTAIELCGGVADFHVPHRIREGYGMKDEVIERAAADGVRLIISVDTGIRAFAAAETAARLSIDLIVTDHHLPGQDGVPKALTVLNPNQAGCDYPCKSLCGAGVAFKLAQALMQRKLDGPDQSRLLTSFMKVVAIATIADAVPLVDENRVFAKLGLEALRSPVNVGLRALLEVADLGRQRPLTSGEVAFRIAPRLNAAGRMDVARDVIELFSIKDPARARALAARLDKLNGDRQEEERRILAEIETRVEQDPALKDAYCVVIDGEGWHRGVIGITATRVVERYGRPALVLSRDGEEAHGSGRSIRTFHLLQAIESCSHLFTRYGGHSHAVGFSLPTARVPELRTHLDQYARRCLSPADFEPVLDVDWELPIENVTPELLQVLARLEPFGQGNPEPVFVSRNVQLSAPARILKDKHIKLKLSASLESAEENSLLTAPRCDADASAARRSEVGAAEEKRGSGNWRKAITYEALGWRMAERVEAEKLLTGDTLDVAFTVGQNDHPEYGGLELTICDFKVKRPLAQTLAVKAGE
ncbi:MAG TPA: single-stranded-DNA-specific exonuclease RecJ [Terriglobales bacterium]|nr:single-stranded-DNA-specific exonuclease RecJ [Terriglobales bacterium]